MFEPRSVAVIGASNQPDSLGFALMRNLLAGNFSGPLMPVTPRYQAVAGVLAYPDVESLPLVPDLALICTPPATIPGLVAALAKLGTRAAVIITAGLHHQADTGGRDYLAASLQAARPQLLRLLGPNCAGLIIPRLGLNASFANSSILGGRIAFVSQSGAVSTAVLDWARGNRIGFSYFISLGNSADVDFGDVLDFLADDPSTDVILLYMKNIRDARKFMSSARAAGRSKQVLAVRVADHDEERKSSSHTASLLSSREIYDAAFSRAGILQVETIQDLFDAVETLARARPADDDRLTIISNGGGPGRLAAEALRRRGEGSLFAFSPELVEALQKQLPASRTPANPLDILGDAPISRYLEVIKILLAEGRGTLLLQHSPSAMIDSAALAEKLVEILPSAHRPVLTCWLGGEAVAKARRICAAAGIPNFGTPEMAVRAFLQLQTYRRNQETLMETPSSIPENFVPDSAGALAVVEQALADGRQWLTEPETKTVLSAYGIAGVETRIADDPEKAAAAARELGFPVALKILSPDVSNKLDVGGLVLNLESADEVHKAAGLMGKRVAEQCPEARLEGFTVQRMVRARGAYELIIGMTCDPVFGPLLLFGQGGAAVEVINDHALALPPLNLALAREVISRTRLSRLLGGFRDRPAVDLEALCLTMVQVAQIVVDLPAVIELEINPLYADENGVVALDARMKIAVPGKPRMALAIRPYPKNLEETVELGRRQVVLRPIRPEDEPQHHDFIRALDPEDLRLRFFGLVRDFYHRDLARFTQIDYNREMAFIATALDSRGAPETLGVVRAIVDPDKQQAEFAIIVRSRIKERGLGRLLMKKMIRYLKAQGVAEVMGEVLTENRRMLALARSLGFHQKRALEGGVVRIILDLKDA